MTSCPELERRGLECDFTDRNAFEWCEVSVTDRTHASQSQTGDDNHDDEDNYMIVQDEMDSRRPWRKAPLTFRVDDLDAYRHEGNRRTGDPFNRTEKEKKRTSFDS